MGLFIVEKRNQEALLPIIREDVALGSMIWSDMWPPYMRIGQDVDGLIHEFVNYSERFVIEYGVHTQNIEREWEKLKHRIMRYMKGTGVICLNLISMNICEVGEIRVISQFLVI
ncbi:hypothetical protein RF11_09046 [Thelohanellus kitauei]|uniref:Uncharacterized protein n=1 Tax=Thelohanellus kitauei TaxID=669202 RepID=A0A0C2MTR5_THEKT|nr:hypothetical protein RF11_09046 [Thelohanellus kitauei]